VDALNLKIENLKKYQSADPIELEKELVDLKVVKRAYKDFGTLQKILPRHPVNTCLLNFRRLLVRKY